ncbi:MAG: chromosomal replication initiator protein DnaA [Solirubrobacteraceae bacterium]
MELLENLEPIAVWREIRAELRRVLGQSTYEIWIAPLEVSALENRQLLLTAPPAIQSWVATRFGRVLETCAQTVLGTAIGVVVASTDKKPRRTPTGPTTTEPPTSTLNPRYRFDQFVIGDTNRLAHAACLAVAEFPGQAYNPLFLHAPPGLGKTHLLHAIGNYLIRFGVGGGLIRYTTVESFTNHFVGALGSRSLDRFKQTYRDVDVLLIDDVQFLASKAKTEEEFFHTFNALYEQGRQLVLTCDRLPHALLGVEERLRERFEAGLVADIQPPDFGTRVAILRKRALLDQVPMADPACLELIAERIVDNVRALEGALIRVVAYHSLTNQPVDLALTARVLDTLYPQPVSTSPPPVARIQSAVASFYDVSVTELISSSRTARVAWPRQVAMYLTRELTGDPLQAIGQAFGSRNHATILHACKRVADRAGTDRQTRTELEQLKNTVLSRNDDRVC